MIFLYSIAVFTLALVHVLVKRRAAGLEKQFTRVAREADALLRQPAQRPGNGNRFDPFQVAKQQYLLGQLIQKRDRVEGRYAAWQGLAERLGQALACVRGWKGRALPYTLGAVDVYCVLALADQLGLGEYVSFRQLAQAVLALLR